MRAPRQGAAVEARSSARSPARAEKTPCAMGRTLPSLPVKAGWTPCSAVMKR